MFKSSHPMSALHALLESVDPVKEWRAQGGPVVPFAEHVKKNPKTKPAEQFPFRVVAVESGLELSAHQDMKKATAAGKRAGKNYHVVAVEGSAPPSKAVSSGLFHGTERDLDGTWVVSPEVALKFTGPHRAQSFSFKTFPYRVIASYKGGAMVEVSAHKNKNGAIKGAAKIQAVDTANYLSDYEIIRIS